MLAEVQLFMRTPGRTLRHQDRLHAKVASQGARLGDRAASGTSTHTIRSSVSFDPSGFRRNRNAPMAQLDELAPDETSDRWFPKVGDHGLAVISHLDRLLDASDVREAVLADPFFGEEALQEVTTRLTHAEVQLTIVASWGALSPDSDSHQESEASKTRPLVERRLGPLFDQVAPLLSLLLRFINVVQADGGRAFHDRYLLLIGHDGLSRVYLLSNSLNRTTVRSPFCMSLLSGRTKFEAKRYIDGLTDGKDVTSSTDPTVNFSWLSSGFKRRQANDDCGRG